MPRKHRGSAAMWPPRLGEITHLAFARSLRQPQNTPYLDLHGNFPHRFSKRTSRTEQAYHSGLTRHSVLEETSSNTIQSMNALRQWIRGVIGKSESVVVCLV